MANRCSVCNSPDRLAIETAVRSGVSFTSLGKRYHLDREAIAAHKVRCVAAPGAEIPLQSAHGATDGTPGLGLAALVALLEAQVRESSGRARLDASKELRLAYGELAKSGAPAGEVDIRDVKGWALLRSLLATALEPYPEARAAVADAIRKADAA